MNEIYDMNVEYDAVCQFENKLSSISKMIAESSDCMLYAIRNSGEYLSGEQYAKACENTFKSMRIAQRTVANINQLQAYLSSIKTTIEAYNRSRYGQ